MTKRLMCLVLALIMLLSLCMTACSTQPEEEEEEEAVEEVQRKNLVLTIYAITDEKTTKEALEAVEKKVSNHCVAKYKTAIDLRFFTEAEYQAALNDMYDKFAAEEAALKKAEAEKAASEASEAAYKATLSKEERVKYEQKQREEAKKAEEEAKKKAEEEAELIELGKDVATVKETQMDIIFIPGMTEYYSWSEQGLLLDINNYITGKFKKVTDYVYPSYITGATIGTAIYGIPNNQPVVNDETYLLLRTDLVEKYAVDTTKIRSVTDLESICAQILAAEPGVAPFLGDWDPEGVSYYPDVDMAHTIGVYSDTLLGGKYTATAAASTLNPKSSYSTAFVDYIATRAAWRSAGYLADQANQFFATVEELNEEEKAAWVEKGYTPVLYKGAEFDTEACLNVGLFGISKYCREPERAMEVLQLMSIDSELRNLLAFGVEDVHYQLVSDELDENVIEIIDDSYTMDFNKIGNTIIGYTLDTMDPDYIEKAKQKNLNSRMSAFLGFRYNWEDEKEQKWLKLFSEWKEYVDPIYETLRYGTPDYMQVLTDVYNEVYKNTSGRFSDTYANFQDNCAFRSDYKAYIPKLDKLDGILHFEDLEAAPADSTTPAA